MHKLLVVTLIAMVPFTSLRVICVGPSAADVPPRTAQAQENGDCEEICLRSRKPDPEPNCLLLSGPCLLLLATVVTVTETGQALPRPASVTVGFAMPVPDSYVRPAIAPQSPPPKA